MRRDTQSNKTFIHSDSDLDEIAQRVGVGADEKLRSSSRRENHLEKFASLMAMDPDISLRIGDERSYVDLRTEGDSKEYPEIVIKGNENEQHITEYTEEVYDLMAQEMYSIHEVGHVLYTDWPSFENRLDQVDSEWKSTFKHIWNLLEDGAIELQLKREFADNVRKSITTVRANMSETGTSGSETNFQNKTRTTYDMSQALQETLWCLAIFNDGTADKILDQNNMDHIMPTDTDEDRFREFYPRITEAVGDVLSEPSGIDRNEIIWEFWLDVKELLESADVSRQQESEGRDGQNNEDDGSGQSGMGSQQQDAHELDEENVDSQLPDERDDGDEEVTPGERAAEEMEQIQEESDSDEEQSGPGRDEDLQDEYEEEIVSEAREMDGGDGLMEEIEEMCKTLQGGEESLSGVVIAENEKHDPNTLDRAKDAGRRVESIIGDQLKREARTRTVRNQQFGTFDENRMMQGARGSANIFERQNSKQPDDYAAIILKDRSGSMSGDVDDAEVASGGFAYGLDGCDVEVQVMDFAGGEARLTKPFRSSIEASKDKLFTGHTSGGTPLTQAFRIARERLENHPAQNKFLCVVTDGAASDKESYLDAVSAANFPVLGIYITSGRYGAPEAGEDIRGFDHMTYVDREDSVTTALINLSREVML